MNRRCALWGRLALLLLVSSASAGCETTTCTADVAPPEAAFRIHLPPAADVTGPETVRACKSAGCATAILGAAPTAGGGVIQEIFTDFLVTGQLSLGAGDVRILDLRWTLTDVDPKNPHDDYTITVTDSAGQVTGRLTAQVQYSPAPGLCGTETWTTPVTTD